MKNTPAGNWQKWTQIKIKYTYTVRTPGHLGNKLYLDKMICPWGMHNFLGNLMSQKKCYNSFSTLPEDAVTHFRITKESFDKDKISIVSSQNDGDKG